MQNRSGYTIIRIYVIVYWAHGGYIRVLKKASG